MPTSSLPNNWSWGQLRVGPGQKRKLEIDRNILQVHSPDVAIRGTSKRRFCAVSKVKDGAYWRVVKNGF